MGIKHAQIFAVLATVLFSWIASAVVPIVPQAIEEEFNLNFLEEIGCDRLGRGQKLSVNPMSVPANQTQNISYLSTKRSTQGERRMMIQMREFKCLPEALAAVGLLVQKYSSTLSARDLTVIKGKMSMAKDVWMKLSLLKYLQEVRRVLFMEIRPELYQVSDDLYPWTYPDHGAYQLREILAILANAKVPVASELSAEMITYLTRTLSMQGHPGTPRDFVSNQNTFFTETVRNTPERVAAMVKAEKLNTKIEQGYLCAYKNAEIACSGVAPTERVECVLDRGLAAGCADVRALEVEEKALLAYNTRVHKIPMIAPFTRQTHPDTTYESLCVSAQRAHHSHHLWEAGVMQDGATRKGFRDAWVAMFAHSAIHINRALNSDMPQLIDADQANPLNPATGVGQGAFRLPLELRQLIYYPVPGVVDGKCEFDPADDDECPEVNYSYIAGAYNYNYGHASDDFNRADSTNLGANWQEVKGDFVIAKGQVFPIALNTENILIRRDVGGQKEAVEATFAGSDHNLGPRLGVILRFVDTENYYAVYRSANQLRISKVVNGVETILKSTPAAYASGMRPFRLKGKVVGEELLLELDGVAKLTATDSTFHKGSLGIMINSSSPGSHMVDDTKFSAY